MLACSPCRLSAESLEGLLGRQHGRGKHSAVRLGASRCRLRNECGTASSGGANARYFGNEVLVLVPTSLVSGIWLGNQRLVIVIIVIIVVVIVMVFFRNWLGEFLSIHFQGEARATGRHIEF